ncbi:uncharacterized protein LOC123898203 isoform X2 [Trifolium pratense]|uniref:uncharacterized protein LOC123898203 isoform X2 n=1 Tax=Trifolium pratense TaxID=57577 RepID=UPI001E694F7F|nr:uncharacterized protein LOC123898203 isoform X2 [Trifolium pratense]
MDQIKKKSKLGSTTLEVEKKKSKVGSTTMEVEKKNLPQGSVSMEVNKKNSTKGSVSVDVNKKKKLTAEPIEHQEISQETQMDHDTKISQVTEINDGIKVLAENQEKSQDTQMLQDNKEKKPIEYDYDSVKDVTKKKEIWRLGVILDDMWIVSKGESEVTMEMLLRDIKGYTIQATVMTDDIEKWKEQLAQGQTYYMRNFRVADNDSQYKMTPHKFRLIFVGATRVNAVEIPEIPKTHFYFKDFEEISNGTFRTDLLIDAIGVVNSIGKIVTATTTRKANVAFTIKDQRDKEIDCTLWDLVSEQFINGYNQRSNNDHCVIIMRHVRVREAQGSYPLQLTNVWNGTKILFDTSIPEIEKFRASLPKETVYASQNRSFSTSTQLYTQSYAGTQYNTDENFMRNAQVLSLGAMKKLKKDAVCVTVVSTSHIRVSNGGWFFYACNDGRNDCSLKCEGSELPFVCRKSHTTNDPRVKYKLDVEVYDGDDTAKFVFWDNTLDEMVGLTAKTLLEQEKKNGYGDQQEYPRHFDAIMERKFAFRVKWQIGWGGMGSVVMCKDSPDLIAKIQEQLPVAESTFKDVETINIIEEELCVIPQSPTIQAFTKDDIEKFAHLDDGILSTPNVSASSENDISPSSQKTPAKRTAAKEQPVDSLNLDCQASSTRSGKLIKKEKI